MTDTYTTSLCRFSKSTIYPELVLGECPLGLSSGEHRHCPCRKRLYDFGPSELRVLSCCFPETWRGDEIHDPPAFAAKIKANRKQWRKETMSEEEPKPKPKPATTALTPTAGTNLDFYQRITDPIQAVHNLGTAIAQSHMFGCKNDSQGRVLAMIFLSEGIPLRLLMQEYHLIDGQLTMKSAVMLAKFRLAGGEHTIIERSSKRAAILLKLKRQKQEFEFTWEEAKAESYVYGKDGKTLKDNWETPRRQMQMLWSRVISDGVKAMAPECTNASYTPEDFGVHEDDTIYAEFEVVSEQTKEERKTIADPEPVVEEKPTPEPELTPEPEPTPPAEAPPEKATREQLVEMKGLKDKLGYGAEVWKQILEKFGVATAKDLAPEEADRLLLWLHKQADKASSKNELEQWANRQIPD